MPATVAKLPYTGPALVTSLASNGGDGWLRPGGRQSADGHVDAVCETMR